MICSVVFFFQNLRKTVFKCFSRIDNCHPQKGSLNTTTATFVSEEMSTHLTKRKEKNEKHARRTPFDSSSLRAVENKPQTASLPDRQTDTPA